MRVRVCDHFLWTKYLGKLRTDFDENSVVRWGREELISRILSGHLLRFFTSGIERHFAVYLSKL